MRRRPIAVNLILAVAVVVALLVTYQSVNGSDDAAPASTQTTTVRRGDLTATVSASGNVESATDVSTDFTAGGGVVTDIFVKPGDVVRQGAALARVDQTSAREQLASARASLASAQGQYLTATQGRTAAERRSDDASIKAAEASVSSARVSLRSARSTYDLNRKQQDAAVGRAEASVASAEQAVTEANSAVLQAQSDLNDANASGDSVAIARARTNLTSAQQQLSSAQASVTTSRSSVTTAKEARATKLLQDRQAINGQEAAVRSAQRQVEAQKASVEASRQPARPGAVKTAQAAVDSARISVDSAEGDLADTTLRAPVAGTVASVNGVVGESSTSGTSASAGTSSSSGAGASAASPTTGTDSSSAASSTGFIKLTNVDALEVTAKVAEADISSVKVGQTVNVTFPADGSTASGTVTSVDVDETVTNDVVEYGVTVALVEGADDKKIGQSTSVDIVTGSAQKVLIVPSNALTTSGGRSTVTVRKDGRDRAVTVRTGLTGDDGSEVLGGISEGDRLVVPDQAASGGFTFPSAGLGGIGGAP